MVLRHLCQLGGGAGENELDGVLREKYITAFLCSFLS